MQMFHKKINQLIRLITSFIMVSIQFNFKIKLFRLKKNKKFLIQK